MLRKTRKTLSSTEKTIAISQNLNQERRPVDSQFPDPSAGWDLDPTTRSASRTNELTFENLNLKFAIDPPKCRQQILQLNLKPDTPRLCKIYSCSEQKLQLPKASLGSKLSQIPRFSEQRKSSANFAPRYGRQFIL